MSGAIPTPASVGMGHMRGIMTGTRTHTHMYPYMHTQWVAPTRGEHYMSAVLGLKILRQLREFSLYLMNSLTPPDIQPSFTGTK